MKQKFNRFLRMIFFPIDYQIHLIVLNHMPDDNIYVYPLILYFHFNKEHIRKKYINGKSMTGISESRLNITQASLSRHLHRNISKISPEVKKRYLDFTDRKEKQEEEEEENMRDLDQYIKDHNIKLNTF